MKAEELLSALEREGLFTHTPTAGDEQNYVDRRIVGGVILPWLGYEPGDFEYNTTKAGSKPDYMVKLSGAILFFIEDKSTAESNPLQNHRSQIMEYLKKISRRGIIANGFCLWVVELQGDDFKVLYGIDFKKAKGGLFAEDEKSNIERFYREFSKERFVDLNKRIDDLACSEEEFLQKAQDIEGREEVFIDEVKTVIGEVKRDVFGRLRNALSRFSERNEILSREDEEIKELLDRLVNTEREITGRRKSAFEELEQMVRKALEKLGYLSPVEIESLKEWQRGVNLNEIEKRRFRELVEKIEAVNSELQRFHVLYSQELSLAEAYFLWRDGWKEFLSHSTEEGEENEPVFQKEYSLQVAYAFFIKVFILRVLEDKGLIKRLLSDGGFSLWRSLTDNLSLMDTRGYLRTDLLFNLAYLHVKEKIFSDIEKNPVYDWYVPDDILFLRVLETLNRYRFTNIRQDIIGYIYEKLMGEIHRHDLGVYLTPPELVDYMLDRAGYRGRDVIGRKVIDPACGSGTFLVHAVRRYREALETAEVQELSEKFIRDVQENFYGVDINAFSVYLAGVNLFVQILDDIKNLLDQGKTIKPVSFRLEVANTFRIWRRLKDIGFYYVFSNPPYINAKTAGFSPPEDLVEAFRDRLRGDVNTYALFLCIAQEIVSTGGRISYIVPLTLLGDQQTNNLRKSFERKGSILHITKFHRRTGVLFEGVIQAVVVFVWEKGTPEATTSIAWGGVKEESRRGMIEEARRNTVDVGNIVYRFSGSEEEEPQREMYEESGDNHDIWVVLSGRDRDHVKRLYEIFDLIYGKPKTLKVLLSEMGIDVNRDFVVGIDTGKIARFHVGKHHPHAMILYKGEDIRPFGTLPENPTGVKGRGGEYRPPYVAPKDNEERAGVNKQLWEIYENENEENLVIFNRIVNTLNYPRNIRGTVSYRDRENKKVFTDKVWVLKAPNEHTAKKLACLLFSLPFNFQYNAVSTNTQVNKNVLLILKVPDSIPDEVVDYYNILEETAKEFKSLGIEDITEWLDPLWYGLREGVEFKRIIPWQVLTEGINRISLENFLLRYGRKLREPRGERIESYLNCWSFVNEDAKRVIELFSLKFANERYLAVKEKLYLPDNPAFLVKRLSDLEKRFSALLGKWRDALFSIDKAIFEAYGIPASSEELVMPSIV